MRTLYESFDKKSHNSFKDALTHEFKLFNEIALLAKEFVDKSGDVCGEYPKCTDGCPYWNKEGGDVCLRVNLLEVTKYNFYSEEELKEIEKMIKEKN